MSHFLGHALVPSPAETAWELVQMCGQASFWRHISLTVFRGTAGLGLATVLALITGIPCGLSRTAMDMLSPLVTALQGCPPIIWISLLLVWVGIGSVVPIIVVLVAVFPILFLNMAQGVAALDPHLFQMARIYHVSKWRILKDLVVPGIARYTLAAYSFALGITWKVTATSEFFGADSGIGARLYWAYRILNMPRLFAWTAILVIFGLLLETSIIQPLRTALKTEDTEAADDHT